jgi:hypothetical protein
VELLEHLIVLAARGLEVFVELAVLLHESLALARKMQVLSSQLSHDRVSRSRVCH